MSPWQSLKIVELLINLTKLETSWASHQIVTREIAVLQLILWLLNTIFLNCFWNKILTKYLTVVQHMINQAKIFKTLVYVKVQAHTQDSVQIDVTTSRLVRWWLIRRTPFIIRTGPEESKVTERRVPRTFDYVFLLLCDFNWTNWKWQVL